MRYSIDRDKCIGCGMCVRVCPVSAVSVSDYTAPRQEKAILYNRPPKSASNAALAMRHANLAPSKRNNGGIGYNGKRAAIEKVNIKVNGREYAVPSGITILEAARIAGIEIPTSVI